VPKVRDKRAALKSVRKAMRRHGRPEVLVAGPNAILCGRVEGDRRREARPACGSRA
jgi:hypothetical protein